MCLARSSKTKASTSRPVTTSFCPSQLHRERQRTKNGVHHLPTKPGVGKHVVTVGRCHRDVNRPVVCVALAVIDAVHGVQAVGFAAVQAG